MADRILKDGINEDEKLNKLTFPAEVFYRRLLSAVDNAGTIGHDLPIIRCKLYPLRICEVKEENIQAWIWECIEVGLIDIQEREPKPLIILNEWFNHVLIRRRKRINK